MFAEGNPASILVPLFLCGRVPDVDLSSPGFHGRTMVLVRILPIPVE